MTRYPHIRADKLCPLCPGAKEHGLLMCWDCADRYHDVEVSRIKLRDREDFLVAAEWEDDNGR